MLHKSFTHHVWLTLLLLLCIPTRMLADCEVKQQQLEKLAKEVINDDDPQNQIFMTEGDHGQVDLQLGRKVEIFDDGGPEEDGANGVTATIILSPAGEADCIKLTNQGISFAYTAHLYIYKGGEVNDDNLIVDLTGSLAKFDPIISDADFYGGKLTIKYVGAGSYTRPNFAISAE